MRGALRGSLRFAEVRRRGYRAAQGAVVVYAASNGTERARLGMAVARLDGGVTRNRVRRWIREALRAPLADLRGVDVVVSTGPDALAGGYAELEADVRGSLRRAAARLGRSGADG